MDVAPYRLATGWLYEYMRVSGIERGRQHYTARYTRSNKAVSISLFAGSSADRHNRVRIYTLYLSTICTGRHSDGPSSRPPVITTPSTLSTKTQQQQRHRTVAADTVIQRCHADDADYMTTTAV